MKARYYTRVLPKAKAAQHGRRRRRTSAARAKICSMSTVQYKHSKSVKKYRVHD
jgi:hypothetical protein